MEQNYLIVTDSTCDLPASYYEEHGVPVIAMHFTIDGDLYADGDPAMPAKQFYDKIRTGSMPSTAQVTPEEASQFLTPFLEQGKDILYICFSSGLSGTCGSVRIAAQDLMEQYPGRKIVVVDSLCASLGEGLLVHHAVLRRDQGDSLEEVARWLEENKLHLCHFFTVDDLHHLHRGGRVSKTAAVVGSMLGIKPVLHVDDEGHLIPISKIRGRRQSLDELVKHMVRLVGQNKNPIFFVSHGDAPEDAEYVAKQVKERTGISQCLINTIGPVIGAHSGPGTVALFFLGDSRR